MPKKKRPWDPAISDREWSKMYPQPSKVLGLWRRNERDMWDIGKTLGQVNVLSRINPVSAERFKMTKESRRILRSFERKKAIIPLSPGFELFAEIHNIPRDIAARLWTLLSWNDLATYEGAVWLLERGDFPRLTYKKKW